MCSLSLFEATLKDMVYCSPNLHRAYIDQRTVRLLRSKKHVRVKKLTSLLNWKTTLQISNTIKCAQDHAKLGPVSFATAAESNLKWELGEFIFFHRWIGSVVYHLLSFS